MILDEFATYDYDLPPELIAQTPAEPRDVARLLVMDRAAGTLTDSVVADLPGWLRAGDLLVVNNTRVLPARLRGRKRDTGGEVEVLLLHRQGSTWHALARPAKKLRPGTVIEVVARDPAGSGKDRPVAVVTVEESLGDGAITVSSADLDGDGLSRFGSLPLPPYIQTEPGEPGRYQTTFASVDGSVAAPTAGLHVTSALRERLAGARVGWAELTLHVGLDTFRTPTVERLGEHRMHREYVHVPAATRAAIAQTKAAGGRVVAVGTTSARSLESLGAEMFADCGTGDAAGWTDLFIRPGHGWAVVDALMTNFHVPRTTLMVMVSAFASVEATRAAYRHAIDHRYRFLSFGDAMLIV
ncbi:MAG: tRNA preQ1(34) S-adenosylmethionine ribosyltransferase-isomerase QueA [Thermomicrobiales bacterium]